MVTTEQDHALAVRIADEAGGLLLELRSAAFAAGVAQNVPTGVPVRGLSLPDRVQWTEFGPGGGRRPLLLKALWRLAEFLLFPYAVLRLRLALRRERRADVIVCVGFSQGASMAWRAAVLGRRRADGIVALAGDIPPELKDAPAENFPIALVAGGVHDEWYTPARLEADLRLLEEKGAPHGIFRFNGAHEWTDAFRGELGKFLGALGK
jgi:pimeloyl-ACP methyl ester carboxylesterase